MLRGSLRSIREKKQMTLERVVAESRELAAYYKVPSLGLDAGWLSRIEREAHELSAFKMASLCLIYKIPPAKLLRLMLLVGSGNDRTVRIPAILKNDVDYIREDMGSQVPYCDNISGPSDFSITTLVKGDAPTWTQITPDQIASLLNPHLFGVVGLHDFTMWPLLCPGAIVHIDSSLRKIEKRRSWMNEQERPLYFLALARGYACAWCDLSKDEQWLSTVPHPLSAVAGVRLRYHEDVSIVGRVVGVSMRYYIPRDSATP